MIALSFFSVKVSAQTFTTLGIGINPPIGTLHVHTVEGYYWDQPVRQGAFDYYKTNIRITNTSTGTGNTDGFLIEQMNGAVIWATMEGDLLFANLPSTGGSNVTGITDAQIMSSVNMRLGADGILYAKEIKVTLTNWPDFVFSNGFRLLSLAETESYIKENGHLPGVPSAAEVEEKGMSVGEMNKVLLQKVEELTLHVIELQKQIDELKKGTGHE